VGAATTPARTSGEDGGPTEVIPISAIDRLAAALSFRETGNPFPIEDGRTWLRLGFCASLSRGFLRELIHCIDAAPGAPGLTFLEASPEDVVAAARRGQIDVGFIYGAPDLRGLRAETLWREPLMVLMPEAHPLAKDTEVRPAALRAETIVVAGALAERSRRQGFVEGVIGGPPARLDCLELERESVAHLVSLGHGLSLTPSSSLGAFYPGVAYRPLAGPGRALEFRVVWRDHGRVPGIGPFLASARAFADRWERDCRKVQGAGGVR
jgi:DNA-binding transcriptional LysR family regulator